MNKLFNIYYFLFGSKKMINAKEARQIREDNLDKAVKKHTSALMEKILWNIRKQALIICRIFAILHSENDRLPSEFGEVFCEFENALHSRTTRWRPIVCNDENFFHEEE